MNNIVMQLQNTANKRNLYEIIMAILGFHMTSQKWRGGGGGQL
jgi:hypothetical protein